MLSILAIFLICFVTLLVSTVAFGEPMQFRFIRIFYYIIGNRVLLIIALLLYVALLVLKRKKIKLFDNAFKVDFNNKANMYQSLSESSNKQQDIRSKIKETLNTYMSINHILTTIIFILIAIRIFTIYFRAMYYDITTIVIAHIVLYILISLIRYFFNRNNKLYYDVNRIIKISKIGLLFNFILMLWAMGYGNVFDMYFHYALFFAIYIKIIFMFIYQIHFSVQNENDLSIQLDKIFDVLNNKNSNDWLYDDTKINNKTAIDHSVAIYYHRDSYIVDKEKTNNFGLCEEVNIVEKSKYKYYFYPIFMVKEGLFSKKVYLYKDLMIDDAEDLEESYFVTSEQKVINKRWDHSNIDGSKDKRFKDNFSVKTFKIGRIVISIKNKSIMNICMTNINSYNEISNILNDLRKEYLS